jgi:hypothetical protein
MSRRVSGTNQPPTNSASRGDIGTASTDSQLEPSQTNGFYCTVKVIGVVCVVALLPFALIV